MSKIANPTKVITGVNTRWSYANVWDPKSINGAAPKYSVSLIIPKSDTVTVNKIKAAIQAAYEEGESKLKGTAKVCPALDVIKTPLRDGDKERPGDEAYKDSYFINANSASSLKSLLFTTLFLLLRVHLWHQSNRLDMARYLLIDVRFCSRSRKHIRSKRKHVHTF